MKLLFLGTGAADWPRPDKKVGDGRRTTSQLLDGRILIDCGWQTLDAIDEFGVDVDKITDVVISHPHPDHYTPATVVEIARRRASSLPPLVLHVNYHSAVLGLYPFPDCVACRPYRVGDEFDCAGAHVLTFTANHMQAEAALPVAAHLLFETEKGGTLLYLLDGTWLLPQTFDALRAWREKSGRGLDAVVWELTCGTGADARIFHGHCNLGMLRLEADALRRYGVLRKGTKMFCSHIARYLGTTHDALAAEIAPYGFILARDGLDSQVRSKKYEGRRKDKDEVRRMG